MTGCNDDLRTAPRKTAVSALPAVDAGSTKMIIEGSGCIDMAVFRSKKDGGGVGRWWGNTDGGK